MADDPKYYTLAEQARIAVIIAKAGVTVARGGNPAKHDAAVDRLKEKALAREAAEKKARDEVEAARQAEKAKKKAERWW